jgi:hypothetical protein
MSDEKPCPAVLLITHNSSLIATFLKLFRHPARRRVAGGGKVRPEL